MYRVWYTESASTDLGRLKTFDRRRIVDAINHLARVRDPARGSNVKQIHGVMPPWSDRASFLQLRVGGFRVFFDIDPDRPAKLIIRAVAWKGRSPTGDIV